MSHNCKTCLCHESCYHLVEFGEGPMTDCQYYKDEDMYIKAPCPIGTTAYLRYDLKDGGHFVNTVKVVGLHLRDTKSRRNLKREEYLVVRSDYGFSKHIPFSHIGKYLFFTKKEAEQGCCDPKEDL